MIKMPLGMEIGLARPMATLLDGDPGVPTKKGGTALCPLPQFSAHVIVAKRLDGSIKDANWYGGRHRLRQHIVLDMGTHAPSPLPPQKKSTAPNFRPMSTVAKRLYVSGTTC